MQVRVHIFYSGYVQGVGFRYTTRDIAGRLGVSGWVKNLQDGRVEVVAEGDKDILQRFMDTLRKEFKNYIQDAQVSWEDATDEFSSFNIRF